MSRARVPPYCLSTVRPAAPLAPGTWPATSGPGHWSHPTSRRSVLAVAWPHLLSWPESLPEPPAPQLTVASSLRPPVWPVRCGTCCRAPPVACPPSPEPSARGPASHGRLACRPCSGHAERPRGWWKTPRCFRVPVGSSRRRARPLPPQGTWGPPGGDESRWPRRRDRAAELGDTAARGH